MFTKYNDVYANDIEEFLDFLKDGYHPFAIIEKYNEIIKELSKHIDESNDIKFAYLLKKYNTELMLNKEESNSLLELVNKSYLPAYSLFANIELKKDNLALDDKETYFEYLNASVQANDAYGLYLFSDYLFIEGNSVFDPALGFVYLKKACDMGLCQAQYLLGEILYSSSRIKSSRLDGLHYLTLAANQNNIEALILLGKINLEGKKSKSEIEQGFLYLERVANLNSSEGLIVLGKAYLNPSLNKLDEKKALSLFLEAAKLNDPEGDFYCGLLYLSDMEEISDLEKGLEYMNNAAKYDDGRANDILGDLYFTGDKVKQDYELAYKYFRASAECYYDYGIYHMAYCLAYGLGIKKDLEQAKAILNSSVKNGFTEGMIFLGQLYLDDENDKNIDKAIKLFIKAGKTNKEANIYLGDAYIKKAMKSYEKGQADDELIKKRIKKLKKVISDEKNI